MMNKISLSALALAFAFSAVAKAETYSCGNLPQTDTQIYLSVKGTLADALHTSADQELKVTWVNSGSKVKNDWFTGKKAVNTISAEVGVGTATTMTFSLQQVNGMVVVNLIESYYSGDESYTLPLGIQLCKLEK